MAHLLHDADYILDPDHEAEDPSELHFWPRYDLKVHTLSPSCWCNPTLKVDDIDGKIYTHNSADGREDYETGKRKPN